MVLLILPCSARKPYFKSSSHKRFFNTLRELDNHLAFHVVSVTSPLGLVPRELEFCYPAAHYDIAVTGNWNASEVEMLRAQLAKLNPKQHYAKAIVHAGSSSEIMTDLVKELGIDVKTDITTAVPASGNGSAILPASINATAAGGLSKVSATIISSVARSCNGSKFHMPVHVPKAPNLADWNGALLAPGVMTR